MKFYIRTGRDEDLEVPSGAQLVVLLRQRFLSPDDEVRKEGSERWRKLRDIPEYARMFRAERASQLQFKWIFYAVCLGTFGFLLYGLLTG
jgi:hypothetical protein